MNRLIRHRKILKRGLTLLLTPYSGFINIAGIERTSGYGDRCIELSGRKKCRASFRWHSYFNSFVAALSIHDGNHYEAMDTAFKDVNK